MRPLTILFTNVMLTGRTGTELYIVEAVRELANLGHRPIVYSPNLGSTAEEIRELAVPVVDDLSLVRETPDLIHGHHAHETVTALVRWPSTPAVFVVHDWSAWHDRPPVLPGIVRYIAVDWLVRDRVTIEAGVDPSKVELVGNWADTTRFRQRDPLPARPERALVYSNYVREDGVLPNLRDACERAGVKLDVAGQQMSRVVSDPENLLPRYDLVFAKGKSALEAVASGCSVVLCDERGLGALVTSRDLEIQLRYNLGRRLLTRSVSSEGVYQEILRYDAADAASVTARVRAERSVDRGIQALVSIYENVVAEGRPAIPDEHLLLAEHLQSWSAWTHPMQLQLERSERERDGLQQYVVHLHDHMDRLHAHMARLQTHVEAMSAVRDRLSQLLDRAPESVSDLDERSSWFSRLLSRIRAPRAAHPPRG